MEILTCKQRIFVQEYLTDRNATRAAKAAGYSSKTAAIIGTENLRKPNIAREIEIGLSEQMRKTEITADRIIRRIGEIAFSENSRPSDVLKACELLGKRFGIFEEREQPASQQPTIHINEAIVRKCLQELDAEF